MRQILITGGTGFLGACLLQHFAHGAMSGKYTVRGVSSRQLDIRSPEAVNRLIGEMQPDWVIHCAAISSTAACTADPALSRSVNVDGTINVARACRSAGSKMIFCSSDQVYFGECGGHPGDLSPHSETETLHPQGIYGIHKLEAEMGSAAISADTVSLRLSWMYDILPLQPTPIPPRHSDLYTTLAALAADRHAAHSFPVNDYRALTWVREVALNMEAALDLPGGVYNFGSSNNLSTWATARAFMEQIGGAKSQILADTQAFVGRPRNLCMAMQKAEACEIRFSRTVQGFNQALKKAQCHKKQP